MKSMKKLLALLLALSVTMAFMPVMAFADEATEGDENYTEETTPDLSGLILDVYDLESQDATLDGDIMTANPEYIYPNDIEWEVLDIMSASKPYSRDLYLVKYLGEDKFKLLKATDIVVKDSDGNIVENAVTQPEDIDQGMVRISLRKPDTYTLCHTEIQGTQETVYETHLTILYLGDRVDKVKKSKVTGVKATAKKGSVKITWKAYKKPYASAYYYEIYRSTKKNSGYKKVGHSFSKSFTNKSGLKKGKTYYYKVRVCTSIYSIPSKFSSPVKVRAK